MKQSKFRRVVKRIVPLPVRVMAWRNFNHLRARLDQARSRHHHGWEVATMQDLYYCCRLLLNREPNAHELKGYEPQLRQGALSLQTLTGLFLDQPEFHQRQAQKAAAYEHPTLVELPDFRIFVSPENSIVGKGIVDQNGYETHVTSVLQSVLRPGMTVVDVGANVGYLSLVAARAIGENGKVLCVEPDPNHCALLQMSADLNGFDTIEIFPFAAAEKSKSMVYDGIHGTGVTTDIDADFRPTTSRRIVRAVPLDLLLLSESRVDVLKMDVDGAEDMVLRGATETLRRHRPILFSEFCPQLLNDISKVSGRDYLQKLLDLHYDISIIEFNGSLLECGTDIDKVLGYLDQHQLIYLDLLSRPIEHS